MRLCEQTLQTGTYPFVTSGDPLINYPVSLDASARAPLFNMMAIASAKIIEPFLGTIDALGWSMLFLPAIYGALLIFPVYGIGKEIFGKKAGIIAALLVAIIPIHIGSGHGSAFSLFDHDSFILLLTTIAYYFFIKSFKEKQSTKKSFIYIILTGILVASILLAWDAGYGILLLIIIFSCIKVIVDIIKKTYDKTFYLSLILLFTVSFLITLPYYYVTNATFGFPFISLLFSIAIAIIIFIIKKLKLPWIISIPSLSIISGVFIFFLYLIKIDFIHMTTSPLVTISQLFFGGIYSDKISLTISEAHTFNISQTFMAFGIALYFLSFIGFISYLYKIYKDKLPVSSLFFILIFIMNLWFTTRGGRFINDLIPQVAIFSGFVIYTIIRKINYPSMIHNIKSLGGFHGVRKSVKLFHILGVLFVIFLVVLPNTYCTLDAAVPGEMKQQVFGENYSGAWGNYLGEQVYWSDACYWLSQQDTNITKPEDRPAILTWWDYGFYVISMSGHPAVADNYQDGIPPASNFLTSQSELEAISILIIRIAEGTKVPILWGTISSETETLFKQYFPEHNESQTIDNQTVNITINKGQDIINIMNYPKQYAPSYNQLILPEYGNTKLLVNNWNAMYHDVTKIILTLPEEQIIQLYSDIMSITGHSIRYFGFEQRDLTDIFGVFPFLADKSTYGYTTGEDDFFSTIYTDKTGIQHNETELKNLTQEQIKDLELKQSTIQKEPYYNSMIYRMYYGLQELEQQRMPTYLLKHFTPAYVSPAITILKYYEGANITVSVTSKDTPYYGAAVIITDKYGIPHDAQYIISNQTKLIAPEGNITLLVVKDQNIIKQVPLDTPISYEEATRQVSLDRYVPISIDTVSLNLSLQNITDPNLTLSIAQEYYPVSITEYNITNINYNYFDLVPDTYTISITNSTGGIVLEKSLFINEDTQYNLTIG